MKLIFVLFSILFIAGCSSTARTGTDFSSLDYLYEIPPEFKNEELRLDIIGNYTEHLADIRFYLDPGHGGEDHNGKSPNKEVIEAEVNLRVALHLKKFLEEAGGTVYMTREGDETVDLHYRSQLANESDADIFISIHHNAPGKSGGPWINYTSTYYHATEEDYEYEPFEHDLARYIQRDLSYAMGNPGGLGSFDGTYSDYWIYPGMGFSVLRRTEIPAVLIECSFFSNYMEEIRLQMEDFNEIQAWGIFKGLGKFFKNGYPVIKIDEENCYMRDSLVNLEFSVRDSIDAMPFSIVAYIDSSQRGFEYDEFEKKISMRISGIETGIHTVRIITMNKRKAHSFPFERKFYVGEGYVEFQR